MPRRARIVVPGLPLHVVQRGNNKAACFFDDDDRRFYLHHLSRLSSQSGCAVHAYCLMTNHVHLLLTPETTASCARLMRRLDLLYSQYANRKYRRSGSLWEGRFRSCVVESETYLLQCYRYIESNPVRAGMALQPAEHRWSSYACNALGADIPLITPHEEYLRLGADAVERQSAYRTFFDAALDLRRIRDATNGNFPLGADAFVKRLGHMLGTRVTRARAGRPPKVRKEHQPHPR
jgi:putative transposase